MRRIQGPFFTDWENLKQLYNYESACAVCHSPALTAIVQKNSPPAVIFLNVLQTWMGPHPHALQHTC